MLKEKSDRGQVFAGVFWETALFLIFTVLFAWIVSVTGLSPRVVSPLLQVVKVLSVLTGALLSIHGSKGLSKGLTAGLISCALCVCFLRIVCKVDFGLLQYLAEFATYAVAGACSGIIAVNLRKE